MKLVLMTLVVFTLLPRYAIAQGVPHHRSNGQSPAPKARIGTFPSTSAPRWTQPISQKIAEMPSAPDTGTPNSPRTPGGTRRPGPSQACKQTDKPLTALVPENGKGLTMVEHPVFWFYIPYTPEDVYFIEFSLHDQNQNETTTLYRTSLQLPKTPGVVGIPLPPSPKHSLKVNESYHWRLIVNCDHKETFEDVLEVDGWVTRVQQSPNPWYDELTNLAKRYLWEPQNPEAKRAWAELLKSVGLEELAQAPLVRSNK